MRRSGRWGRGRGGGGGIGAAGSGLGSVRAPFRPAAWESGCRGRRRLPASEGAGAGAGGTQARPGMLPLKFPGGGGEGAAAPTSEETEAQRAAGTAGGHAACPGRDATPGHPATPGRGRSPAEKASKPWLLRGPFLRLAIKRIGWIHRVAKESGYTDSCQDSVWEPGVNSQPGSFIIHAWKAEV